MDGLELVVGDGHADEWVDVAGAVFPVQEPLPVGEQTADPVLAFGGRVDIVGFGSSDAACLSSAKAARAPTHRFKTGLVSRSMSGGISGRSLCGTSGRQPGRSDVLPKAGFCDMS